MPKKHPVPVPKSDAAAAALFIAAIVLLLATAGYVIFRLASERAYRQKWRDYNDCGIA